MAEDRDDPNAPPEEAEDWTSEEHTQLMTRYERIAAESAVAPSLDGKSVVAEFNLGGSVPRIEETRGRYQSKDIYIRLENTIYGPVTQQELGQLLSSGQLTGFESASADLQHWTPLIYHPRMALSGEIDPDATHDLLHQASTLPAASRAPSSVDLEALADLDDDEELPGTPLAAILIKPIRVSRKTGLPLPVHADLRSESIEKVVERTEISEERVAAGVQALSEFAEHAKELADAGQLRLAQPPPLPPEAAADAEQLGLDVLPEPDEASLPDWDEIPEDYDFRSDPYASRDSPAVDGGQRGRGSDAHRAAAEAALDATGDAKTPVGVDASDTLAATRPSATATPQRRSAALGLVVALLAVAVAVAVAWFAVRASTPEPPAPPEAPATP